MPQLSCSFMESYRPCGAGYSVNLQLFLLLVQLGAGSEPRSETGFIGNETRINSQTLHENVAKRPHGDRKGILQVLLRRTRMRGDRA